LALIAIGLAAGAALADTALTPANVQKISIDGLKAQLGNPDWIILDVRTAHDWDDSKTKIKGAIRADFHNPAPWIDKYPKDKTIVFYCK
jgi:rhodanese-related sulfurtransferase